MQDILNNLSTTSIVAIVIRYLIEAAVLLAAGYFYGRYVGFNEGFKLGAILAKCRLTVISDEEDDENGECPETE